MSKIIEHRGIRIKVSACNNKFIASIVPPGDRTDRRYMSLCDYETGFPERMRRTPDAAYDSLVRKVDKVLDKYEARQRVTDAAEEYLKVWSPGGAK